MIQLKRTWASTARIRARTAKKQSATEAAQRLQNDSWWRLLRKGQRPKRMKTGAANAGEARRNGQQGAE